LLLVVGVLVTGMVQVGVEVVEQVQFYFLNLFQYLPVLVVQYLLELVDLVQEIVELQLHFFMEDQRHQEQI
jgi:hypothetical protein